MKIISISKQLFIKYKMQILYLFFGACSMVTNVVAYQICYNFLGINNVLSTSIAWVLAVFVAFVTNKFWVFESKKTTVKDSVIELAEFVGFRVLTGLVDVGIMWIAVDCFCWNGLLWKIISNILVIVMNYIASKLVIFK